MSDAIIPDSIRAPDLEFGARSDGNEPIQAALESIAISLKRIADTMDGTSAGLCVTETIFGRNPHV